MTDSQYPSIVFLRIIYSPTESLASVGLVLILTIADMSVPKLRIIMNILPSVPYLTLKFACFHLVVGSQNGTLYLIGHLSLHVTLESTSSKGLG